MGFERGRAMGAWLEKLQAWWERLDQTILPAGPTLAISGTILVVLLYIAHRQQNPAEGPSRHWLEQQIELLAGAGVHLRPGIGIGALLKSFPASAYRRQPPLLLAVYGSAFQQGDRWQSYSDHALHFDFECIDDFDCYDSAVFTPLTDLLPEEVARAIQILPEGKLSWQVGTATRTIRPSMDDDWADEDTVFQLLNDIDDALPPTRALTVVEDGQALTVCVIAAAALPRLRKAIAPDMRLWADRRKG